MPSRPRLLTTAVVAASLLAPVERGDAPKRKNGTIFEIETRQRSAGGSPTGTLQPVFASRAVMFRATQWRLSLRFDLLQVY
jgi:hypothetical protein